MTDRAKRLAELERQIVIGSGMQFFGAVAMVIGFKILLGAGWAWLLGGCLWLWLGVLDCSGKKRDKAALEAEV